MEPGISVAECVVTRFLWSALWDGIIWKSLSLVCEFHLISQSHYSTFAFLPHLQTLNYSTLAPSTTTVIRELPRKVHSLKHEPVNSTLCQLTTTWNETVEAQFFVSV